MVYRIFAEKKEGLRNEAEGLKNEIKTLLGIDRLQGIRVINRYDVENISEELFEECRWKVFAEPQLDNCAHMIEDLPFQNVSQRDVIRFAAAVFAVEALPGRFDQRADSAEQCIQALSCGERPTVSFAKVYVLYGDLEGEDINAVRSYLINPAESREASLMRPGSLKTESGTADTVATLKGFTTMSEKNLTTCISRMGLAMDEDDLRLCVDYFRDEENRDPTITELRVIDTYWSERCRHTVFDTRIDGVTFGDKLLEKAYRDYLTVRKSLGKNKPVTLADIASIAAKHLKLTGRLDKLDESDESNVCTVKINVQVDGENEPWRLLFSSRTNNHSTEIEPFGGAGACLGGCIMDTLSGRAYAYSAMRVTGAADPLQPVSRTLPGRLPQRSITTKAVRGASSYANQAGICTGLADEIYHPGYAVGRLESCAVMAAVPAVNVRREKPGPGDIVMLLGGPTGRDGIAFAAADSTVRGIDTEEIRGTEVQSGDASELRKMQRFFRNSTVTRMIRKCSALGTGGLSFAAGKLADGIDIDLDAIPGRYEGLDGTDLAISESGERMICVIDAENEDLFRALASDENLSCVRIAALTDEPRLVMRWKGRKIVDISGAFLKSDGAEKHVEIAPENPGSWHSTSMYREARSFTAAMHDIAQNINICSKRGLVQNFDSSAGSSTVLMPFGGSHQLTPVQAMVHKIPLTEGDTDDCSMMAYGYNPFISDESPYHGAYLSVVESIAKLIATGASFKDIYLSFRENFGFPGEDPVKWGRPLAALLGAFEAQTGLGVAAIGREESFSDSFANYDVPPALISFAVTMAKASEVISPEFKRAGHRVIILRPELERDNDGPGRGLPKPESLAEVWKTAYDMISSGEAVAACTPGTGGIGEAIMKMSFGNGIGFRYEPDSSDQKAQHANNYLTAARRAAAMREIFGYNYGSIILEINEGVLLNGLGVEFGKLGYTTSEKTITLGDESLSLDTLLSLYEGKLESVFPTMADSEPDVENVSYQARSWHAPIFKRAEPKVLIPVFPGTNCEYDSARAVSLAGAQPEIIVIRNRTPDEIKYAVEGFAHALRDAQIVLIPGGASCGCEPDGSAKFITSFFRNAAVEEGVTELLEKNDGLMCGICDGFQALIKLGLVPFGRIVDTDATCPTLTYNSAGATRSGIAAVRIASNKSPWLRSCKVGEIHYVPVAHGEGRFIASDEMLKHLAGSGQIATQYADLKGEATGDSRYNPNGSLMAVEGITSPDGRVLGRMGHPERVGKNLYRNVKGSYFLGMFENAVRYFK